MVAWRAAPALLLVIGISACAGSTQPQISPAVARHFKGLPKGITIPGDRRAQAEPWAAWAGKRTIYVMTWGSGSCPKLPSSVKAIDAGRIDIHTEAISHKDAVCTADLAVTTSVVRLPATAATTRGLTIRIDRTTTHLAARQR